MNIKYTWTKDEIDFLIKNYSILGQRGCADILGKPVFNISQRAQKLNIKIDKLERAKRVSLIMKEFIDSRPLNELNVNPEQFYNINTPELAYFLGLLWADGHVGLKGHIICLYNLLEDAKDYERILFNMGKWHVRVIEYPNSNRRKAKEFRIGNKPLVEYLLKYDYGSKSWVSADKILSIIPENLQHYWFRGLIDGDGCIYKKGYQIEIASGFNQDWNYMIRLCQKFKFKYRIHRRMETKNTGHSSFYICGKQSSYNFLCYIYQNREKDKIGFTRKYDLFLLKKQQCIDGNQKINQTKKIKLKNKFIN